MKKTTVQYFCDVCRNEANKLTEIKYPVIFHTEQTEGRSCSPYISTQLLECCDSCINKILRLHGWGAQGDNDYKIKDGGFDHEKRKEETKHD